MTIRTRRQFAEAVRQEPVDLGLACLLIEAEAEPGLDPVRELAQLDALAAQTGRLADVTVRDPDSVGGPGGPAGGAGGAAGTAEGPTAGQTLAGLDVRTAAEILRQSLGVRGRFHGDPTDYDSLYASLLSSVLRRRRGLPIMLSVVWVEVARRLGIPAYPVGLPGHVIVGIGSPSRNVLVDPFCGGRLITVHEAAERVRSTGVPFTRAYLAPMSPVDLLMRVLGNIRVWAARTEATTTRLWAVELSLLLPHHPVHLRRERGELLVRLGDFLGGAEDLTAFADAVGPLEPAAAAAAREAAHAARARLN
ncbi:MULTISPECIES: transglutaminase-like domain-containing protein [Protofrankia]|uniref:Putative transcriptional regulator n=1 Tax=Candidatus Protofrankia datiscae TaxID=2716812 RepID=F8AWF1_9ACTN|nr:MULTISPECIES: transglutaminase-like domain-containing protein [Protofrankia]AEH08352.1 putative transcriptional regulator [Candidatus Protofrankia datiscae]